MYVTAMPDIGIFHIHFYIQCSNQNNLKNESKSAENSVYFKGSLLFGNDPHDLNKITTTWLHINI